MMRRYELDSIGSAQYALVAVLKNVIKLWDMQKAGISLLAKQL
jgi:hypothetical protein